MVTPTRSVVVPAELAGYAARHSGAAGRAWIAELPGLAAGCLDRWELRQDGPPRNGMAALVLPVVRPDGTPAALKLQQVDEETAGEPVALRRWDGRGAVRLLDEDPAAGALLLERLDETRPLSTEPDVTAAVQVLAELLARLVVLPAPPGMRRLDDIALAMLEQLPHAVNTLPDRDERRLLQRCAGAVRELLPETADRLLHWDLHYDNVLAGRREPWLAIDPKPLAGDPGFDLMPALHNRWAEAVATGDPAREVRRRFDLMVEVLGLDRQRAVAWTLGRVLQNALWDIDDGETRLPADQVTIADALAPPSWR